VIIVDEFTGRQMPGRRWSDGLHQAVEAKEGVKIGAENRPWRPSPSKNYSACTKSWRHDWNAGNGKRRSSGDLQPGRGGNPDEPLADPQGTTGRGVPHRKEKFEAVVNGILQEDNSLANGIRHYHERGQPVLVARFRSRSRRRSRTF